jgi:hypothetical protein
MGEFQESPTRPVTALLKLRMKPDREGFFINTPEV